MADHKAKQVLDAVTVVLTGLTTTGTRVKNSRTYSVQETPALTVNLGAETISQYLTAFIDKELLIELDIFVKSSEAFLDATIQEIRKEIHIALMADVTLGLNFIIDIEPVQTSQPVLNSDSDHPVARVSETWRIIYRHSLTDASI